MHFIVVLILLILELMTLISFIEINFFCSQSQRYPDLRPRSLEAVPIGEWSSISLGDQD